MIARYRRFLSAAVGSLFVLLLAILLVRVRHELETSRETTALQTIAQKSGVALAEELGRGERSLLAQAPSAGKNRWTRWTLGARGYRDEHGGTPPISESALRRALSSQDAPRGATLLLGPIATDQGGDAFILVRDETTRRGTVEWRGAWQLVSDVMEQARVAEAMRAGYRLQLFDVDAAAPIYQSDGEPLGEAAVATPLHFAGSRLEIRTAPRSDLTVAGQVLAPSLLLLLAVLAWPLHELRRSRAEARAVEELAEAEARRRELNAKYGTALERLASLESSLQLASLYDSVTGLGNRSSLLRRIETSLNAMRLSRGGNLAVLAIGFDHINQIRNSFGAGHASRALTVVVERLRSVLPSQDLLFGTGDFQLAAVLPDTDAARSAQVAQRIISQIEAPVTVDSHAFLLHPGVGIATTASGYDRGETLLDHANAALSALPRDAPTRYSPFDSAATRDAVTRLQLEVDLERAFDEAQFVLEYEPFVVPASGEVAGFEALIRWDHPTEGRLSAARFVPIAMQAGLSHRLNSWVLREATQQMVRWRRAGHEELFVNVNLSAEAFLRPQLAEEIGSLLAEVDLPGRQLVIELTESTLVQDMRAAARTLQGLGKLGIGAWLDDFGTGYSSLAHLRALPLKGVKIDRSFIENIELEARDFGLVKAVIDLISYLGMQSIIEGVETVAQYELLTLTPCDLYQGYYFSRSMPAAEAERWMKSRAAGGNLALAGGRAQRRQGIG